MVSILCGRDKASTSSQIKQEVSWLIKSSTNPSCYNPSVEVVRSGCRMLSKNNPSVDNIITFCNSEDGHDVEAGKQDLFCNSDGIEYQESKI